MQQTGTTMPTGLSRGEVIGLSIGGVSALAAVGSLAMQYRSTPKQKRLDEIGAKVAEHETRIGGLEQAVTAIKAETTEIRKGNAEILEAVKGGTKGKGSSS